MLVTMKDEAVHLFFLLRHLRVLRETFLLQRDGKLQKPSAGKFGLRYGRTVQ